MAKYQYYCEVAWDDPYMPRGVYTFSAEDGEFTSRNYDAIRRSNYVWRQGSKGGVKIIKDRHASYPYGYITNSEKHMKKFMWIKLQARELV